MMPRKRSNSGSAADTTGTPPARYSKSLSGKMLRLSSFNR